MLVRFFLIVNYKGIKDRGVLLPHGTNAYAKRNNTIEFKQE